MTITKTIGTAGGRDYATMQAAWDALPATLADDYIFELYNDSKFTGTLVAQGKTHGDYTVTFRAAAGQGFRDHPNRATNPLRFDPANGVAIEADSWNSPIAEGNSPLCVILDGLQIKNTNVGMGTLKLKLVKNCIVDTNAPASHFVVEGSAQNCVLIQRGTGGLGALADRGGNIIIAPNGSSGVGLFAEWEPGTTSNNAVFGFATPFGVKNGGTYTAGSDYNATDAATTPALSSTHNKKGLVAADQFVSVNPASLDLRVKAGASIIGAGLYDAALDPDILKQARATPPTIGAVEYAEDAGPPADTTPPTLTSATGAKTGTTTASGSVSTDEANGTMYAIVSVSATKPTPTQMQAGQSATGGAAAYATSKTVTATGAQTFSATGLAPNTTYQWHYQQPDAAGNNSAVVTSPSFTTDAAPAAATAVTLTGPTSGTVGVASSNFTVAANGAITGTVVVTPAATGGGSFTPTTVSLTSGSPTATFTYTPASAGAKTISVTNNGALTNPSSITYTASAANTPPTFSGTIANINGTQGTALTNVDVAARFTDSDALTYSKIGTWPAGVTLTGSVIGGTPTVSGTFANLKVRATDTASQWVESNAFTITLADAPSGGGSIDLSASTFNFATNNGTALASKAVTFWLHDAATGALVAKITGTTNASANAGVLSNAAIQPATPYRLDWLFASGEFGCGFFTSAA